MNLRASAAADLKSIQKPGPKLAIFFLERETLPKRSDVFQMALPSRIFIMKRKINSAPFALRCYCVSYKSFRGCLKPIKKPFRFYI